MPVFTAAHIFNCAYCIFTLKFLSRNSPNSLFYPSVLCYVKAEALEMGNTSLRVKKQANESKTVLKTAENAQRSDPRRAVISLKDTHSWSWSWKSVLLKHRPNDWITVSSFGDSVIVGLQTVRSIDFLSDAMKPGVPSLCKLAEREGGRWAWDLIQYGPPRRTGSTGTREELRKYSVLIDNTARKPQRVSVWSLFSS